MGLCHSKPSTQQYAEDEEWDSAAPTVPAMDSDLAEQHVPLKEVDGLQDKVSQRLPLVPLHVLNDNVPANTLPGDTSTDCSEVTAVTSTATRASSTSAIISRRGVTLTGIRDILDRVNTMPSGAGRSTRDFVARIVKPLTATLDSDRTLISTLADDQIDEYDTYVSHAWDATAQGTLEAVVADGVARVQAGESEPCYFLDFVCLEQHIADPTAPPDGWTPDDIKTRLAACQRLLVVAAPVPTPLVTHRAQCLLEVTLAALGNVRTTLTVPPSEEPTLVAEIIASARHAGLVRSMTHVDSRHAKATHASELQAFRQHIETGVVGSYLTADTTVKRVLEIGLLDIGHRLGASFTPGTVDAVVYSVSMGRLCVAVGDYDRAIKLQTEVLMAQMKIHGSSDPRVAESFTELGSTNLMAGKPDTAYKHFDRALEIRQTTMGSNAPEVADTYFSLAQVQSKRGLYDKASTLCGKALDIHIANRKGNTANAARVHSLLGTCHLHLGNAPLAIEAFEKALTVQLDVCGDDSQEVLGTYKCLGDAHFRCGEFKEALWNYKEAAQHASRHCVVAECLSAVASAHEALKEYAAAIKARRSATEALINAHGTRNNTAVAKSYAALAAVFTKQGDLPRAVETYSTALSIWTDTLQETNADVADAFTCLGDIYKRQSELPKATESYEKAIAVLRQLTQELPGGEFAPRLVNACTGLANVLMELDRPEQTIKVLEAALQILSLGPGTDASSLASLHMKMSEACTRLGNTSGAHAAQSKADTMTPAFATTTAPPAAPTAGLDSRPDRGDQRRQSPLARAGGDNTHGSSMNKPNSNLVGMAAFDDNDDGQSSSDESEEHRPSLSRSRGAPTALSPTEKLSKYSGSALTYERVRQLSYADSGHDSSVDGGSMGLPAVSGHDSESDDSDSIGDGFDSRRESPVMFTSEGIPIVHRTAVARAPSPSCPRVNERTPSPEYDGWSDDDEPTHHTTTLSATTKAPPQMVPATSQPVFRYADKLRDGLGLRGRSDSYQRAQDD